MRIGISSPCATISACPSFTRVCTFAHLMATFRLSRAIAYEKSGRWFTAEEPFLRAKERTDAGSSAFRHPRSELTAPLPQEVEPAFNNRKLHMRLPWPRDTAIAVKNQPRSAQGDRI